MPFIGDAALARARAGDEDAFRELTDPYRAELGPISARSSDTDPCLPGASVSGGR